MKTITELNYGYMPRGPNGRHQTCERCDKRPARFLVTSNRWWWPFSKRTEFICDHCVRIVREPI